MKINNDESIRLRCFVAMAFGREDTDAIYDDHIQKAIEEANMTPVRVDKVTHLDRVDAKIRKELRKADIVVSDLTYARPSVYWEAGYAERSAPVIYTCRSDHLSKNVDDEYGNFAVHFDLKNANITPWKRGGNAAFHQKLKKLLIFAAKPIRAEKGKFEAIRKARKKFSQRSVSERRKSISLTSKREILRSGYKAQPKSEWQSVRLERSAWEFEIPLYWKKTGSTLIFLDLFDCFAKLNKTDLQWYPFSSSVFQDKSIDWLELPTKVQALTRRRVRKVRRISILPVLNNVPTSRIEEVTRFWRRIEPFKHYYRPFLERPHEYRQQTIATNSSREFVVFDKILSAEDYAESVSGFLAKTEDETETIIPVGEQLDRRY